LLSCKRERGSTVRLHPRHILLKSGLDEAFPEMIFQKILAI